MDFDETAVVEKWEFLLNRVMQKKLLLDHGDEEEVKEEVKT